MAIRRFAIGSRPYCNVQVWRRRKGGQYALVSTVHNAVLAGGLNQLRDAAQGTAWGLNYVGLGSNGTTVAASQTWGLTPLLVSAPTDRYARDALCRVSFELGETELNGSTIREIWLSPDGDAPPTGRGAYMRAVIPDLEKTADFTYLFVLDCVWGGGCCRPAWSMFAALADSDGLFTYKVNQVLCGSGSRTASVADTALESPWDMDPLAIESFSTGEGTLTLAFGIPPDVYNGLILNEVGLYFTANTGTGPLTLPGLYTRTVKAAPYEMIAGAGARVSCPLTWESA